MAFGFFKMNPRYQPADTKYNFNFQDVTMNITPLYVYYIFGIGCKTEKCIEIKNVQTSNHRGTEKKMRETVVSGTSIAPQMFFFSFRVM